MLRHVALVRTDVSQEPSASFIRVTRIGELGTTLAATSNRHMLRRNTNWYFFAAEHYMLQAHTEGTNINQSTMTSTTKEQQFPLYNKYILKTP
jgi:hypothetical protein